MANITICSQLHKIKACAFTAVLFEDTFKGENYLEAVDGVLSGSVSTAAKLCWALCKTADESFMSFEDMLEKATTQEIEACVVECYKLILADIRGPLKKG